jgi:GDP-4-dehydro-6-deoxy-D-mannose reductase
VKRVLVTGSNGFVGRILCASLHSDGVEVVGIDVDDTDATVETYTIDLLDSDAVAEILDDVAPEGIIHLAAQSSAARSFDQPGSTIENNLLPALHILEHTRTRQPDVRILVVGSADVYGPVPADRQPIAEAQVPNPVNPYALSKWLQEEVCRQYASMYQINVVMTRSFNHTGAGQRDLFVLPSFARQIAEIKAGKRETRVEVGNIEVKRDFSDVKDVCRAYRRLLADGRSGSVYNVCSGTAYSLRELLEKLAKIAGVDIQITVDPHRVRPADMEELCGDHTMITTDTGWKPEIPIDDTLRSLIEYWSER